VDITVTALEKRSGNNTRPCMRAGHFKKREKREMYDTFAWRIVDLVPVYIAAIGTFLYGIGAIILVPKVKDVITIKEETLYGEEAKNRYELIKNMLPTTYPYTWGPVLWEGDQNIPHIFEVKRVAYDKNTMGAE
jgi:hypothetical protein